MKAGSSTKFFTTVALRFCERGTFIEVARKFTNVAGDGDGEILQVYEAPGERRAPRCVRRSDSSRRNHRGARRSLAALEMVIEAILATLHAASEPLTADDIAERTTISPKDLANRS